MHDAETFLSSALSAVRPLTTGLTAARASAIEAIRRIAADAAVDQRSMPWSKPTAHTGRVVLVALLCCTRTVLDRRQYAIGHFPVELDAAP